MIVPVRETVICENVIECALGEFKLLVDTKTGFFNATKMCLQQGKSYCRYGYLVKSKSKEQLFVSFYGSCLYYSNNCTNAPETGTYCHPIKFLSVAMWCSNKSYVTSTMIINDFFNRTVGRRAQLTRLLERNVHNINTSQPVVDFELAVDNNCWLAIIFCLWKGKKITSFEDFVHKHGVTITEIIDTLTYVYGHPVSKYSNMLLASDFGHHKYYHPILFLKIAALVSDELYIKFSHIVFTSLSGDHAQIKKSISIAEREVNSTSIALSVAIEAPIEPDTEVENDDEVIPEDSVDIDITTSDGDVIEPDTDGFAEHIVNIQPNIDASNNVDVMTNAVEEQHQIELNPTHSKTVLENTSTGGGCKYAGEVWNSDEDDSTCNEFISNSKPDDEEKRVKVYTESEIKLLHVRHTIQMDKMRYEMDVLKRKMERQLRDERNTFKHEIKAIENGAKSRVQQIESVKNLEQEHLEKRLIREKEDVERKLLHDIEVNERKLEQCQLQFEKELKKVKQVEREKEAVEIAKRLEELTYTEKLKATTRAATKERELLQFKLQAEQRDSCVLKNEVEVLREQIEALRLGHSDDEMVSRKRRRVNSVLNMSEQQGLYKLESVVVIRLLNGDVCTFRRQLKSLPNVLHNHKHEILAFECWFLTDNAVQDYNYCKKTINDKVKSVVFKNNHISTLDNKTEIVVRTLYDHLKSMGTIEADVNVLRRFYEEDASAVHPMSHLTDNCNDNDPIHVLLGQAYKVVTNLYNDLVSKEKSKKKI